MIYRCQIKINKKANEDKNRIHLKFPSSTAWIFFDTFQIRINTFIHRLFLCFLENKCSCEIMYATGKVCNQLQSSIDSFCLNRCTDGLIFLIYYSCGWFFFSIFRRPSLKYPWLNINGNWAWAWNGNLNKQTTISNWQFWKWFDYSNRWKFEIDSREANKTATIAQQKTDLNSMTYKIHNNPLLSREIGLN